MDAGEAPPVFIVATANDVSQLPPEMLRNGRWDDLFFVDLPTREEREAIWAIQIRKFQRDPDAFDLQQLAKATEGFTGAEFEQVFVEALYRGFDRGDEPSDLTVGEVLVDFGPLSALMSEQMTHQRSGATDNARPATTAAPSANRRKIAA